MDEEQLNGVVDDIRQDADLFQLLAIIEVAAEELVKRAQGKQGADLTELARNQTLTHAYSVLTSASILKATGS